ncbi:unnamed protein product [Danaus chrysippus]|uniref:(African queen) hypothetical protein n=1 Tax=Danaus chrysippus TaxID=151541 RepID=A0A8J2QJC7_9NEOP|nr:unnamed protein product [Danaus chrysippus]
MLSDTIMKAIFLVFLLPFVLDCITADEEYYVLQKVDLSESSNIVGVMKNFMNCLLERSPCSEAFEGYRLCIPEAFQQACKKCSPEQKRFAAKFLESLKDKMPQDYNDFIKKYDPENKYFDALQAELNKFI